jgi:hypothetical protein
MDFQPDRKLAGDSRGALMEGAVPSGAVPTTYAAASSMMAISSPWSDR